MTAPIVLRRVTPRVYRHPLASPVTTSFGVMRDRPMVLVEVEDAEGNRGYGEVWCNFPAVGAEHRARLVESVLAPILTSRRFADPTEAFVHLTQATHVLALQCAEPGPFAQAIAGIDLALWDLAARRAGAPLWRYLNPAASPAIAVYASGLNPDGPELLAASRMEEGYTAFKLKIGFGMARDVRNLEALRATTGASCRLMVDANQAWDLATASAAAPQLERFALDWLEEPLRCDRPASEWLDLSRKTRIPLAAGENMLGDAAFTAAIASEAFSVLQPDLAKWGGFSGCVPVARAAVAAGKRFCPHYLGGGIGLVASAHFLTAVGGDGMLEIDANPNPLRSLLCGPLRTIVQGRAILTEEPGLGVTPDFATLEEFHVPH